MVSVLACALHMAPTLATPGLYCVWGLLQLVQTRHCTRQLQAPCAARVPDQLEQVPCAAQLPDWAPDVVQCGWDENLMQHRAYSNKSGICATCLWQDCAVLHAAPVLDTRTHATCSESPRMAGAAAGSGMLGDMRGGPWV